MQTFSRFKAAAMLLGVGAAAAGFLVLAPLASADVSPAGCTANNFVLNLSQSVPVGYDTAPPGATTITYTVQTGNPTVGTTTCDVTGVTVSFTTPDSVVHTLQTGGNYPAGTAVATLGTVSYVASSSDEVGGKLTAIANASGSLHDTITGTDPMHLSKSVSFTAIHPGTTVTITPSTTSTLSGGTVNLTITEANTGDSAISTTTVTVTPPGTALGASSTSFTGGDTNSNGILDVGETWTWVVSSTPITATTTFTAVGSGFDLLGNPVTVPAYPTEQASTTVGTMLMHPAIATTLSATTTAIGTPVHDSATITGASPAAGGTVTYNVFAGTSCSGIPAASSSVTVASGTVPDSAAFTPMSAGTFNWQAIYSGDLHNASATSVCGEETLTVNGFSPSIATALSSTTVNVGTPVTDTATLSGASVNAGGMVTYNVYAGTSTSSPLFSSTSSVVNGVVGPSGAFTPTASGTFNWQAVYSGDLNNASATSAYGTETLTVLSPPPQQFPTRTLGFWQTHTALTETVFASSGPITLGGMTIATNGELFGGFYASIPKTSTGTQRSALDKARMQLAQQYLAAALNCTYFGCSAATQNLLVQASADFASGTASQILADASALDAYNNSGDTIGTVDGGAATPKQSKAAADIPFWDALH